MREKGRKHRKEATHMLRRSSELWEREKKKEEERRNGQQYTRNLTLL